LKDQFVTKRKIKGLIYYKHLLKNRMRYLAVKIFNCFKTISVFKFLSLGI